MTGVERRLHKGAGLVSYLESPAGLSPSFHQSGALDSPDESEAVEVGGRSVGAMAPSGPPEERSGQLPQQSGGLEGLAHVANEEPPDF